MKIGILTLPLNTNYGGILQAYALQRILNNMGHDVLFIDRELHFNFWSNKRLLLILRRTMKRFLFGQKDIIIFLERKKRKEFKIISVNTQNFIKHHIKPFLSIKRVSDIPKNYFEAIIVGSDQIWRPCYSIPRIEEAFLSFTNNWVSLKRVSYAASFGTVDWEYTKVQTKRCKSLIQKFDSVSVREDSGADLCKRHFKVEAELVLDPTLLLDPKEYVRLIAGYSGQIRGDLFVYILDINEDKQKVIDTISDKFNYTPFFTSTDNPKVDIKDRITKPVEDWIKSIYNAQFVITDSFHACVFSIMLNKAFIVYGNSERGMARFQSLLKLFKLEDRLITSFNELTKEKMFSQIDWEKTNQILNKYKDKSLRFLKKSLHT